MAAEHNSPSHAALRELHAALEQHRRGDRPGAAASARRIERRRRFPRLFRRPGFDAWFRFDRRHPVVRRVLIGLALFSLLISAAGGVLLWRLSSGPISLDIATPWLTSAIEANFGNHYKVHVGGTQLERNAQGHTAVRLRDITVRDAGGAVVAVAPKAEVGLSGSSLLMASLRAQSFRLVDASVRIRVAPDGHVDVFAGGEQPIASMSSGSQAQPAIKNLSLRSFAERGLLANFAGLLAWIDGLGGPSGNDVNVVGFDGHNLTEVGLSNGSLTIDDQRTGEQWSFNQISVRLMRPRIGGAALMIGSDSVERPWLMRAALTPGRDGQRMLQFEARKILIDDLLALRMVEGGIRCDVLVSAAVEAELAADGMPQVINGSVIAEGGSISKPGEPEGRIDIDRAEFGIDWDIQRRTLRVPFKINAGAMRLTLRSEFAAPAKLDEKWQFAVGGGWVLLDPLAPGDEGLVLKRVIVRGGFDPQTQRITLDQADLGTRELGNTDTRDVSVALSGYFDLGGEQRLAIGLAGSHMSVSALKRVWPVFVAAKVRQWVLDHVSGGSVERFEIATNAPLKTLQTGGPPLPDDGLLIDIAASGTTLQPVAELPPIKGADMAVHIQGRVATVTVGKGFIDVSPGRRLAVSGGVFEVPDTEPKAPPARVRFRVDGPVPAAAEFLALERLREFSGAPFDPATTHGTLSAQVSLAMPLRADLPKGSTTYSITADMTNFSVERMWLGQKIESPMLHAAANNQGYAIKGDVKIGGMPAQIEYRRVGSEGEPELRLQATLDEAGRSRIGFDLGPAVVGPLPVRLVGRMAPADKEMRFAVETDLTPAKIDNLLPGWVKPSGKLARASFTLVKDKNSTRLDDLVVDGQGVLVRGSVALDHGGEIMSANFPVFATSDGDKTTLRADRGPDGVLRVVMRGDVYDGRNFVKGAMSGPSDPKRKPRHPDLDVDIKIGVVAGYNGEALRGLDLRLSRRGGKVRGFNLHAKIGSDTPLLGEMRTRVATGRPVIYIETNDAGALLRFADLYSRVLGGKMWLGMDPPSQDQTPQQGLVSVRDFAIRGEGALDNVVSNAPAGQVPVRNQVDFSQARADFTRYPGRMVIRDGVVRGPVIGATIEGNIDYTRDSVNMRGTLVPLYGLNNMFGQIPFLGLFLGGGSNEGVFGITYEVKGTTSEPKPMVNPISAIAPGLLRKFFEFRDPNADRAFSESSTR